MPLPAQALPAQEVPAAASDEEEAIMEEEAEEVISPDGIEVLQQLMGRQLSVGQRFTHYDFSERYHRVTSVTEWFSDGFRRVINDFHVPSMFKDNFRVTPSKNGTFFHLQTRISPTLLNAADRAEQEFDPSNRDTSTILSSIRQTVNVIANALGTDFDNQWSEGNEYALPFVCNPLPHVGIVWQYGDQQLLEYRMARARSYAPETLHQQIPILRVIFQSQETQRMSAMKADDVVIYQSPTRNLRGAGLTAPPPPPKPFSGGGGGRYGEGFGGGGGFVGGGRGGGGVGYDISGGGDDDGGNHGNGEGTIIRGGRGGRQGAASRAALKNESSKGVATSRGDSKRRRVRIHSAGVDDSDESMEEKKAPWEGRIEEVDDEDYNDL